MKNKNYFILLVLFLSALQIKAQYSFDNVLYGAAYYHEYMPYERLDEDIRLMKRAGLTVVRVGESAWGVFEPQEGNFEFEWMDRILDKMHAAGIKVIWELPPIPFLHGWHTNTRKCWQNTPKETKPIMESDRTWILQTRPTNSIANGLSARCWKDMHSIRQSSGIKWTTKQKRAE